MDAARESEIQRTITQAARAIVEADALLVTAGAGIGVDSGLPDFMGNEGFWREYPPYARLGLSFSALANPRWFDRDPELAWGFYGHRLNLYRQTRPHHGFELLRTWCEGRPGGGFVFTSNVDGQFETGGFPTERIVECHGRIDVLQCTRDCGADLFDAPVEPIEVDPRTLRAEPPLPTCPGCGQLARPNILMFDDNTWDSAITDEQLARFDRWLGEVSRLERRLAVVECGAGVAVPTVRMTGERLAHRMSGVLVRINTRDPEGPPGVVSIPVGAKQALERIDAEISKLGALAARPSA